MANLNTEIAWTDVTWNPATGCTKVSPGCAHCYAEAVAPRTFRGRPFTDVLFHPERLLQPLHWRKPRKVFVNSMSDLFHENLSDGTIDSIFAVIALSYMLQPRHVFQVLTKRSERMREYWSLPMRGTRIIAAARRLSHAEEVARKFYPNHKYPYPDVDDSIADGFFGTHALSDDWRPTHLRNVWMGVSVENQAQANIRIRHLRQTPAAIRFMSVEPLISEVDLCPAGGPPPIGPLPPIDWVIVGGESGPKARPCELSWIRKVVKECRKDGIPVFVKQLGRYPTYDVSGGFMAEYTVRNRKGADPSEWPEDLRIREMPR